MGQEDWMLFDDKKAEVDTEKGSKEQALLTPYQLGPFHLSHRIVHAPMTRCRAYGGVPQPETLVYYAQRATRGGLLVAEATDVMPAESEYPDTAGIYTQEQIDAWKPIVNAVHDKGAIFFSQIWYSGRSLPPEYESGDLIGKFRTAARNAILAGFDGVEIHGAHGYLIGHMLIRERHDISIDSKTCHNGCREALEIVKAVVEEIGGDRVGFRFSPYTEYVANEGIDQSDLGVFMAETLNDFKILYAHFIESRGEIAAGFTDKKPSLDSFRDAFKGTFIAAGGYTREEGNSAIASGRADLIAYGRLFLSNPDLPRRFELMAPLNKYDRGTFYSANRVTGYTDYPTLEEIELKESQVR